jgi:hypothetical protein
MERDEMCICGHPQSAHRTYGCTGSSPNPDLKKTYAFCASAKHFKRGKLPTRASQYQILGRQSGGAARSTTKTLRHVPHQ